MKLLFFLSLFIGLSCIVVLFGCEKTTTRDSSHDIDLLVLNLSTSVENHVLYLKLLDGKNKDAYSAIAEGLEHVLFNLSHYLVFVKNKKTIELTCKSAHTLREDFITLSKKKTDFDMEEIMKQAYKLALICRSKNN